MPKKHRKEDSDGHSGGDERWLLTYADMITLLVAIFIMLYSMSVMNLKQFNAVAISIRSGFTGEWSGTGPYPFEKKGQPGQDTDTQPAVIGPSPPTTGPFGGRESSTGLRRQHALENYVSDQFARLKLPKNVPPILDESTNDGNRLVVIISDRLVFADNSAKLTDEHRRKLSDVGEALKSTGLRILVEGYSKPVTNDVYHDSWALGFARASAVGRCLVSDSKINPRQISLTSYGEWKTPNRSRQLVLNSNGEWERLSPDSDTDNTMDRVVVSVMLD